MRIIFIIFNFFIVSTVFSQNKTIANFKAIKKTIDSIFVLTPHVFIESITKSENRTDSQLIASVSRQIMKKATSVLADHYSVGRSSFILRESSNDSVSAFFTRLDSTGKILPDIAIPTWLKDENSPSRYIVSIFFYGFYLSQAEPYHWTKQAMKTNMWVLNPSAVCGSSIQLIVADKATNKVLCYGSKKSSQFDPRIEGEVKKFILDILRPIYYK